VNVQSVVGTAVEPLVSIEADEVDTFPLPSADSQLLLFGIMGDAAPLTPCLVTPLKLTSLVKLSMLLLSRSPMLVFKTVSVPDGLLRGEEVKVLVAGDSLRTLGELAPELIPRVAPRKILTGPPVPT
jgi:hypothetical protein